jgi:hypothetical protein
MHIETYALVDSGADRSVFHFRFANELLIDLESGSKEFYFGVGAQPIAVYHHKVNIQLIGSHQSIDVEVGFTDAPGVDAILGQAGFFEQHQIKFERYNETIEIKLLTQLTNIKRR